MRAEIDAEASRWAEQVVEWRAAGGLLQAVDAAETAIVEQHDRQLHTHRHAVAISEFIIR